MSKAKTRDPDGIWTDNLGYVKALSLSPDTELVVRGKTLKAKDVPYVAYTLSCGHSGRGIAITNRDVLFCVTCSENSFVVRVVG